MIATTSTGTKVQSLAYAWAAVSPDAHWRRRAGQTASPMAAQQVHGDVAGPEGSLARLQPFQSGSMSAAWHGQTYVVRSCRTPIVKVHAEPGRRGQVEVNDTTYSVATSHHQEVAAAWVGYAVGWVEHPGA